MYFSIAELVVVATVLGSSVLAAPSLASAAANATTKNEPDSFKVTTHNDHYLLAGDPDGGSIAMIRAARKYGFDTPPQLEKRSAELLASYSRTVSNFRLAKRQLDLSEYLSPVSIGGQQVVVSFDTGSSDLWVFSNSLPSDELQNHRVYSPEQSTTFQPMPESSWMIRYGDGSGASGIVGRDVVNVGGVSFDKQAIEIATSVSTQFASDANLDGLFGLAFSRLNTVRPVKQRTFFENVMGNLRSPLFSVDLTADRTGTYEFGNIDTTKFVGRLTDVPVNSDSGFWMFESSRFAINGQVSQNPRAAPAIADTGTSIVLVDSNVAQQYYARVRGAVRSERVGGYIYPCDSVLPDISLAIGETYMAKIPGSMVTFARMRNGDCFGGIQNTLGPNSVQIYGDLFFRAQFVVFDGGSEGGPTRLQIAEKPMKQ